MDHRFDPCAESCEMFVDRVIEDFVNEMMQSAFVRITDEHARPFPDRFETFQLINLRRVILLGGGNSGRGADFFARNFLLNLRHKSGAKRPTRSSIAEYELRNNK